MKFTPFLKLALSACFLFTASISLMSQKFAAGGSFSIMVCEDGTPYAYGDYIGGQFDLSSTTDIQAVAAGFSHALLLKQNGSLWACGQRYLGNGSNAASSIPVSTGLNNVNTMSGGAHHSLAVGTDGKVWGWGLNSTGQVGDGTNTERLTPVEVLTQTKQVACGGFHSLALKQDGTVWAWGTNFNGQLGNGTNSDSNLPVQVAGLTNVKSIAAGSDHSLALKNDGTIWAWGNDFVTNYGNTPVQVHSHLTNVISIAAGSGHSVALIPKINNANVMVWGYTGASGTVPNGNAATVDYLWLKDITGVAAGGYHALALESSGKLWAWGRNENGQLGDGTTDDASDAVQVIVSCEISTSIDNTYSDMISFSVYPNPMADLVSIAVSPSEPFTLRVLNVTGEVQIQKSYGGGTAIVDVSQLCDGMYFAEISTDSRIQVARVVKQGK